jgi:hypothetical protein
MLLRTNIVGRSKLNCPTSLPHCATIKMSDAAVSARSCLTLRRRLAIEICSYAFHPIEPCAFPKSLAVLFGKLLAVRLVSDMRDKHGVPVADHSWANLIAMNTIVAVSRAATQRNGKHGGCEDGFHVWPFPP